MTSSDITSTAVAWRAVIVSRLSDGGFGRMEMRFSC
jgi:hypothetical protein